MNQDRDKEALDRLAANESDPSLVERLETAIREYGPDGRNPSPELQKHAETLLVRLRQLRHGQKLAANRKAASRKAVKKSRVANRKRK